jgi:hypothetical protein
MKLDTRSVLNRSHMKECMHLSLYSQNWPSIVEAEKLDSKRSEVSGIVGESRSSELLSACPIVDAANVRIVHRPITSF